VAALALYYGVAAHLPDIAFPGGRGFNWVRCRLLARILPAFGDDNAIDGQVYLGDGSDVELGSRCQLNRGCRLNRVTVHDNVLIGPDVIVLGKLHRTDRVDVPMVDQGDYTKEPTILGPDAWVGARAIIMPGIVVGPGSIVGAGAVVTQNVPPRTVVAGVPARPIADR
jgi:maltose O-acetyltransferase